MTKRAQVIEELYQRVARIRVDNGFQTDAGATVYVGETPMLGPDDPDQAVAIVPTPDVVLHQSVSVEVSYDIQAITKMGAGVDPWLTVEAIAGDIKRAIEQPDRTLGGLLQGYLKRGPTRTIPRQEGSLTLGAGVTYTAQMSEPWGAP